MKKTLFLFYILAAIFLVIIFYQMISINKSLIYTKEPLSLIMGIRLADMKEGQRILSMERGKYLRIDVRKNINGSAAENLKDRKISLIGSLYEDIPSPYPGEITKKISCPKEFFPVKKSYSKDNDSKDYYLIYAPPRYDALPKHHNITDTTVPISLHGGKKLFVATLLVPPTL